MISKTARRALIVPALLACANCGGGGSRPDNPPSGWRVHRDAGIELRVPEAWTVTIDGASRRIEASGGGVKAVIWPMFTEAPKGVSDRAVARHLAKRLWPRASWAASGESTALTGEEGGRRLAAIAASSPSPSGTAIVFYGIEAPAARFDAAARDAVTVFSSIRISQPADPKAKPEAKLTFARWRDPREGAFSLEVPEGWKVDGGTFRFGAVDVRSLVDVRSPDGAVMLRIGDPDLPTFTEPLPFFPEGSTYSPGYGVSFGVRRSPEGQEFAADYVRTTVARWCGGAQLAGGRDRDDAVRQLNAIYQQYGLSVSMRAGDVNFTCRQGARAMQGYYFAGIQVVRMGGPAIWRAENLLGFIATPERTSQATDILSRMVSSFRIDEQWMARQQQTTAATSAIVTETNEVISKSIADTYWAKQPIESEISRRRSNAILGVEDVVDEHTGRHYRVESGSSYFWINPQGTIAGTDVDAMPRGDFRQLTIK
jgi:hypothetical protein